VECVQAEARAVHEFLGLTGSHFLDLPAARLDTRPGSDLNEAIRNVLVEVKPNLLYVPHLGDVHRDHQLIFQAVMVASRPTGDYYPRRILAYETVTETDWYAAPMTPPFVPNVYVDISSFLDRKLEAFLKYASQVRLAPDQRSIESLRALATTRGHAMGFQCAEAFMLVRELVACPTTT